MTTLRFLLRLNAASCLSFGVLFVGRSERTAAFLGSMPPQLLFGIGLGLLANGSHLLLAAGRQSLREGEVMWFSIGDLAWWSAAAVILGADVWVDTTRGAVATALVSAVVAALGLAQLFQLGRQRASRTSADHWRSIGRSWMALPTWVKLWLVALNIAFLATVFAPAPAARVALISYVASGPLLLAFAFVAGGLTRVTGLGHVVAYLPMLYWLAVSPDAWRGSLPVAGLFACVVICLAFDAYDILRWMRGDRMVIGATPMGLSKG